MGQKRKVGHFWEQEDGPWVRIGRENTVLEQ